MADTIKIGNLDISAFKVGSGDCKVYLGDTLLYPTTPTVKDYLRFVAKGSGTFTFTPKSGAASGNVMSYSLDSGSTWTSANTTSTVQSGDVVFIKGEDFAIKVNQGIGTFSSTANFDVEGNVMSLLYGDNFENQTSLSGKDYAFMNLFSGCTSVINVENMELPATTLASSCYSNMFQGCTSLTTTLELPATTLASYCYSNMFQGCTSLTTAPELPVTTLAISCYSFMFNGCTSLTTAPELPASTLVGSCYNRMFYGCTSLSSITCYATNISADNCVTSWVDGVASSGTFKKPSNMSSWTTGTSGIPNGWTVEDIQTHQWVSYSEGDTVPASLIYGVKLYLDLGADNEIDFQDPMQGGGICFMYVADYDGWYGIDANTSNEIDLSSYYDSTEGCYIVLFSDLGYGGFPIIYPSSEFEFDVQLYI